MRTKIALCQLLPIVNEPEQNYLLMEMSIARSADAGVKLCIFPEDFLYGVLRDRCQLLIAGKKYHYWINRFSILAKRYEISIIPGSLPRYEDNRIFNSTVYINERGDVMYNYSKTNLWLSERDEYQRGSGEIECFDSVFGKAAIIICWDIFDHRLFESAIKQGAQWMIVISFWSINQSEDLAKVRGRPLRVYEGFSDSKLIDTLICSRVSEYNIGIIFCNFGGVHRYVGKSRTEQKAISANRSQVVIPFNSILARLANRKETILRCETPSINSIMTDYEIYYGRRADIVSSYLGSR